MHHAGPLCIHWGLQTTYIHLQLFERLRDEAPEAVDKVVSVIGDIQEPELGLSREEQEMLQERVSIVFHLAATVRFDTPIRYLIKLPLPPLPLSPLSLLSLFPLIPPLPPLPPVPPLPPLPPPPPLPPHL